MTNKINGDKGIAPLPEIQRSRKVVTAREDGKAAATDRVDFSSALQQATRVREAAPAADPERAARVAQLKAEIEAGTYRPDPQKVAESLVRRLAEER